MSKDRTLSDPEIQVSVAELAYAAENAAELLKEMGDSHYSTIIYNKLEALELILRKYNKMDVLRDLL